MSSARAALAAIACCGLLPALWLPGVAGSAPPAIATTYHDAVGDTAMGPDIGKVTVTEADAGRLTFTVDLANRLALLGGESVQVYLETDPAGAGDDYLLAAFDGASLPFLARWGGSSWAIVRYLDDTASIEGSAVTLPVPLPQPEPLPQPGAPPPVPGRLEVAGLSFSPSPPRAGKRFTARLLVRRGGSLATLAAVSCGGNVGRQKLRVLGTRIGYGLATCTWAVPKGVGGRTLVGQVRASEGSETTSRLFRQIVWRG